MSKGYQKDVGYLSIKSKLEKINDSLQKIFEQISEQPENQELWLYASKLEMELCELAPDEETGTPEEWDLYIKSCYEPFCSMVAKLEAQIYNNRNEESHQKQIAVITGGQPGAGKSILIPTYIKLLQEEFDIEALGNNADNYRNCYPQSDKLMHKFPEFASEITDRVVKAMRKGLIEESIAQRLSFVLENTLGDTIAAEQIINAGIHDVWVVIMAVPREESLISNFERYIEMKKNPNELERLVSIEAHDKRYKALTKNVQKLCELGARVIVHSRGKTEKDFPPLEYDSLKSEEYPQYKNYRDAIKIVRDINFSKNVKGYRMRLQNIRAEMKELGMTKGEEEELVNLEEIINEAVRRYEEGQQGTDGNR